MESHAQNMSSDDEIPSANGWFQIAVSSDGSSASVKKIVRHTGNGKPVKVGDILNKLKQLRIIYGIDREVIENLVKSVNDNNVPEDHVVIAKTDVENGENGSIKWYINDVTEENSEILIVPKVKIAERTLATPGKKGKNVLGQPKNPRPGFDQEIYNGDGVICNQETDGILIYESTHTGVLRYKSGTLSIDSGLDISEDKLQVYMDIYAGKVTGLEKDITESDFLKTLEAAGIKYGINSDQIKLKLEEARISEGVVKNVLVAEGKVPVHGKDDIVEWHLDLKSEDINKLAVIPGQTIVTITSKSESKPGIDVFDEVIHGIDGTEIYFKCGEGVEKIKVNDRHEYKAQWIGIAQYESDILTVKSGIKITDDNMMVTMSLVRPDIETDEGNILLHHVVKTLNEHDVIFGIKNEAIKLVLENINKERKPKVDLLVAEGLHAKDALDAKIEFDKEFVVGGKILPNGDINYQEKSYPWNVKVGDVIGKIIPPQLSEDGKNVKGEEIIAGQVEESEPELEGVKKEADGTLRITEDGILLINGINLKVSDSLELEDGVCQKTGNILSDKTVNVKGFVEPGFVLETKGDAIIQDNVEDATVTADGSVVIKSGIRGTKSKIISGGDLTASFAENADLNATGDIRIVNSLINCHIVCKGTVHVGNKNSRKSALVGDITRANKGIEVAVLGSDSFNKTIIEAGAGSDSFIKLREMTDAITGTKKGIDDLARLHEHCCKNPKPQKEQNAMLLKLNGTREQKNKEYHDLLEAKEELQELIEESKNVKIVVHRHVFPGVVIRILNKFYEVREERNSGIFILKGDRIIFEPT